MTKYEKPTLETFKAQKNKDTPFEERAKKFENAVAPFFEEFGVNYAPKMNYTQGAIFPEIVLVDIWQKNESPTKN